MFAHAQYKLLCTLRFWNTIMRFLTSDGMLNSKPTTSDEIRTNYRPNVSQPKVSRKSAFQMSQDLSREVLIENKSPRAGFAGTYVERAIWITSRT